MNIFYIDDAKFQSKMKEVRNIIEALEQGFDDDSDNDILEQAMNHYCSMWDIREGMKYAIIMTLKDQYENHAGDSRYSKCSRCFKF